MFVINNNNNYIDQLFAEIKQYNKCQDEFETYFSSLEYETAKDLGPFADELEKIKELLPGNAKSILKGGGMDGNSGLNDKYRWIDVKSGCQYVHFFTAKSWYKWGATTR